MNTARWSVAMGALMAIGCSCGSNDARSPALPAPAAPTTVSPPPTSAPPATAATTALVLTELSDDERASLLRQGRAALEAHDLPTATARFDRLAHDTTPRPEVLCEAGWVAHRAGDDVLAADRIDLALRLFGSFESWQGATEHPTRCLYNRGQLYEAAHDPLDARLCYEQALAADPSDALRARLAALPALEPSATPTVAGLVVDGDIVQTTDRAALVHALEQGIRFDSLTGHAVVTSLAEIDLPSTPPRHAIVFLVDDGVPYRTETTGDVGDRAIVLAIAESAGFRIGQLLTVRAFSDHTLPTATAAIEHGMLRVEVHEVVDGGWGDDAPGHPSIVCNASFSDDLTWQAICSIEGTPRCFASVTDQAPRDMDHPSWVCASRDTGEVVDIGDPGLVVTPGPNYTDSQAFHDVIEVTDGHVHTVLNRPGDPGTHTYDYVIAEQQPISRGLCNDHDFCPSYWQPPDDDE